MYKISDLYLNILNYKNIFKKTCIYNCFIKKISRQNRNRVN